MYEAVIATYFRHRWPATQGLMRLAALVTALFVGIVFYFLDLPSRGMVFRYLLPDTVVAQWTMPLPPGRRVENVYYLILDEAVPAGILGNRAHATTARSFELAMRRSMSCFSRRWLSSVFVCSTLATPMPGTRTPALAMCSGFLLEPWPGWPCGDR